VPLIIDANCGGDFKKPLSHQAQEIVKRLASNSIKITVGGKLLKELMKTPLSTFITELSRQGRLHRIEDCAVDNETIIVEGMVILSNDPHVLALSRISRTRLLYSNDNNLISDFKNTNLISPKGKVVKSSTRITTMIVLFDQFGR